MTKPNLSPEQVDALLPQTQCGLCGYGGCMPYARALVNENAAINLCPPGGIQTLKDLGNLLEQDPEPFIADMETKAKPPLLAVIREEECIGCTKCIQACPVDAIVGAAKLMHTVITRDCTGCELCLAPCPVDCIDMVAVQTPLDRQKQADHARKRFQSREKRLHAENIQHQLAQPSLVASTNTLDKKSFIEAALLRARSKKSLHK